MTLRMSIHCRRSRRCSTRRIRGAVQLTFDHWQCTLRGELNVSAFQRAWLETLRRHTVLRSTIHSDGLREPVQMVHRDVQPSWTVEDWRGSPSAQHAERWASYLQQDRARPLNLTEAPTMRFALVRLDVAKWKFVWSVPALLLDGWSWPVVFRDVSRLYEAFSQDSDPQLEAVRPYRDYLEWLGRQSPEEAQAFWRDNLADSASQLVCRARPLITRARANATSNIW